MNLPTVFMIANGLAMDAFAVAIANGINLREVRAAHALRFGIFFGGFQFLMPLLGWFLGIAFVEQIQAYDHWVAFILLVFIGGKMLFPGDDEDKTQGNDDTAILSIRNLVTLGIATSIDALAAGVSFAVMQTNVFLASAIIGVVAFIFSAGGVYLGKKLGSLIQKGAERAGGVILILMGLKILIEHLWGI